MLFVIAVLVQGYLLLQLLDWSAADIGVTNWLVLHVASSLIAGVAGALMGKTITPGKASGLFILCAIVSLCMPLLGALGGVVSIVVGIYYSNTRHHEEVYWQFTENADLPFTTPIGRPMARYDSRGFEEQLMYSKNNDDLYRKVLAASHMRAALSIGMLKRAVQHSDEKIRLTAYQTLDKKVTHLNREIQRLEDDAGDMQGEEKSNTWLQIASNYWELLTLEKDEPIARQQLLTKAGNAAVKAVEIMPTNRNAHFTLGRVFMMQRESEKAGVAFRRAMELGMPADKAMPYLAEAAFDNREFSKVSSLLDSLDDAFKVYPPLSHVAQYWK